MKDLFDAGLPGRLPMIISNFLRNFVFSTTGMGIPFRKS